MPPYRYDSAPNRFAPSIAEILSRYGDLAARHADQVGAVQARAAEQQGQIWGNGIASIGQMLTDIPRQQRAQRESAQQQELRDLQIQPAREFQAGRAAVGSMMRGDQLPPGETGPRQQSFLDGNGLFDVGKLTQALGAAGFGHLAPDLVKGAETINDSILKHQELEQKTAQAHALLIGDLADGALKLEQTGTPLLDAMDLVVQPALATQRFKPEEYASIRQHLERLPPEQQHAALDALRDQAARIAPGKTLAEGAQEVDRYGRVSASGGSKPPTEAELAAELSSPDPVIRARAERAMAALKPPPHRTDTEQALDAYAKSIGKQSAQDLTAAERQTYETTKAQSASDFAFAQHQRERTYDAAHPLKSAEPDQAKLEQQYRTVLQRAVSTRSGALGLEDQKVQQANHLLALLEQTYDPKTDSYTIPKTLQGELAAGLARLVAPGGNVGIEMMREFDQRTAKGDVAGALSYVTGHPFPTASQDFARLLKDSIERQGRVAEENREGAMGYLRGLAPTDLEESRRLALESASLNPLRQSRMLRSKTTGEFKMQVSIDGGKTWK